MIKLTSYKRYENETDDELIFRICSEKDKIGTWVEVCDVLNELTGNDYNESAYRKKFQAFQKMLNANQSKFVDAEAQLEEIRFEKRELEKERKKLQTEKLEYSKFLREDARDELIAEKICEAIANNPPLDVPPMHKPFEVNRTYLLVFGDLHDGISFEVKDLFGNVINSYSPEILEDRIWDMCSQVIDLIDQKGITELHIYNLGDNTQGILRLTSQLQMLKLGIIDSTIHCANLLAQFLNELSKHAFIKYQMVEDSNHDQLRIGGAPKNAFTGENVSKIIQWHLEAALAENPNVKIIKNPTGMNFGIMSTYGVLGVHGEVKNLANAINDFSRAYNTQIDYIIGAHMHHSKSEETGIRSEALSVRSIIGVDPYGLSLNKVSDAGASLFTFDQIKGLVCEDRIVLN